MAGRKRTTRKTAQPAKKAEEKSATSSESSTDSKQLEEKPKQAKATKTASPKNMSLEDACRRFVVGYKDHWYPSIDRFAKTQGHNCDSATEEACKSILSAWGAKLVA